MFRLKQDWTGQAANDAIRDLLSRDAPCLIARFGSDEMETTLRHLDISSPGSAAVKFLHLIAGWLPGETRLHALCFPQAKCVPLINLEPFAVDTPWPIALEGKTVLLVHPFEATLRHQYAKRELLFKDPRILPAFKLKTYKTVQSLAGNSTRFPTWFDALDHMCREISAIDFDVALIGAGTYGMSLAAHIKHMGKKAVHMGGATQLLFGIKGSRWDHIPRYSERLYNEHWTRPLDDDRPTNYKTVEGWSYW